MKSKLSLFLAVIFLSLTIQAQGPRPDFNRVSNFDVQHYVLRVSFDRAKKKVIGDTAVQLKPLNDGLREVALDSVGLSYTSVMLGQGRTQLKYKTGDDKIVVTLDRAYAAGELVTIRFKHFATPKKGVYFVPEGKQGNIQTHGPQIWTQGEPDEARHWFPSFDFPSDKATTEQFITAEKGQTIIGNGELIDQKQHTDGTTTSHFNMNVPHSTYLISFVIGEYSKRADKYKEIPLGYYVYPGKEWIVPKAFGKTRDVLRIFEELTGISYPFNKYDQTIVAGFQEFSGMENITATTLADTDIFFANNPFGASFA